MTVLGFDCPANQPPQPLLVMDSVTITASTVTYTEPIYVGDRVRGNIGVQVRLVSGTESTGLTYTFQQAMDYEGGRPTNWMTPSGGGSIDSAVTGGRNLYTLSQDAAPYLRIGVTEVDAEVDNIVEIKIWGV